MAPRQRKTPEELAEQRARMKAAWDNRLTEALSGQAPQPVQQTAPVTRGTRGSSDLSKYNFPKPDQISPIGPLTIRELKSPVAEIGIGESPYVSKNGGNVTFTATGPKVGRGRVPNDVLARYRKAINQAKASGQAPPYLNYNGERYYYQSRGKSLVHLGTKLDVVAAKTQRELDKTPTLEDYRAVFGGKEGAIQFQYEQERMARINQNTPKGYSRGHIRPDVDGGMWHSRNLKLEKGTRADGTGNYQKRAAANPAGSEALLNLHANTTREHIALQGPNPNPRQRQQILEGADSVSRSMKIRPSAIAKAAAGVAPPPKPTVKVVTPKPTPKPVAKPAPKPTPSKPALINPRNPGNASMQIRSMQRAAPDVLQIHPGGSLPSQSLIMGI